MTLLIGIVPAALLAASVLALVAFLRMSRGVALLAQRRRIQPLAHELPYWDLIDDAGAGVIITTDLAYASVFRLQGIDADCLDDEQLVQLSGSVHNLLQGLPVGASLQITHFTDDDLGELVHRYEKATRAAAGIGRDLVSAKVRDLYQRGTLRRSSLYLTFSLPAAAQAKAVGLPFTPRFPAIDAAGHQERMRTLRTLRAQLQSALEASTIRATPLPLAALRQLLFSLLNPHRALHTPDPFGATRTAGRRSTPLTWAHEQSAREQLVYSSFIDNRDRFLLDGRLHRVLTLKALPSATEPALFQALLVSLPFDCRVNFTVELLDPNKSLDELKRGRDQAHLWANLKARRNQEAEAREDDIAELIDQNVRSSIRMVQLAASVVLSVDASLADAAFLLDNQTAEVLRLVNSLGSAQAMVEQLCQLDEFVATLPGAARRGRRFHRCTSENAAHLLPVWQPWGGASAPLLLFQNARNNLVGLDPFDGDLLNPNAFMAGSAGSGKSSTANYLLLHLLAIGTRALIIDMGGSYRRLIRVFGGDYFAVQLQETSLNLFFDHEDVVGPDGELEEHRLLYMLTVVERMMCEGDHPAPTTLIATSAAMYEEVNTLAAAFDHIIIDCPARIDDVQLAALALADLVVFPCGESPAEVWALARAIRLLQTAEESGAPLRAVALLSRIDLRTDLGRKARGVLTAAGLYMLRSELTMRVVYKEMFAAGLGVAQYKPSDTAAAEVRALIDELDSLDNNSKMEEPVHGQNSPDVQRRVTAAS